MSVSIWLSLINSFIFIRSKSGSDWQSQPRFPRIEMKRHPAEKADERGLITNFLAHHHQQKTKMAKKANKQTKKNNSKWIFQTRGSLTMWWEWDDQVRFKMIFLRLKNTDISQAKHTQRKNWIEDWRNTKA